VWRDNFMRDLQAAGAAKDDGEVASAVREPLAG